MGVKLSSGNQAKDTLMWIRWAESDYLSARILLLNGLVVQGAAFANTAIEKFLKAILTQSNRKQKRSHDVHVLYKQIQAIPSELSLEEDFLRLLSKAYKLRYFDDLKEGFGVVLSEAKILAELDRSVYEITQRFRIFYGGGLVGMIFDTDLYRGDPSLHTKNVIVKEENWGLVFARPSYRYEIRKKNGMTMECSFKVEKVDDDRNFNEVPGEWVEVPTKPATNTMTRKS